jgi:hypothetical protein
MKASSGVISWASNSSAAQTVSGILDGDTPTALLFLSFFRDPTRSTVWMSFGAATGTGTQRSHAIYHHGGVNTWAGNLLRDTDVASFASVLTNHTVSLSALGAGTFTLTPSGATPNNSEGRTYWVAMSDVTANLRTLTLTSAGTTKQTTSFDTKCVIMAARNGSASAINSVQSGAGGSWAVFAEQDSRAFGLNTYGAQAGPSNTGTRSTRDGLPKMSSASIGAEGVQGYVTVPTWYSDGYDVTINNVVAGAEVIAWALALDCDAAILPFTVPSSTGAQALTGAGRQGQAAITMLAPRIATADTKVDDLSASWGVATATHQGMVRLHIDDNATPASSATTAADAIAGGQTGATEDSRAAFTSFDSDGVTLTWSDADATAGLGAVLVLGSASPAPSGPSPAAIQYYRRFLSNL